MILIIILNNNFKWKQNNKIYKQFKMIKNISKQKK